MRPSGRIFFCPSRPGGKSVAGRWGKFVAGRLEKFVAARMEGLVRSGGAAYSKGAWVEADGRRRKADGGREVEAEDRSRRQKTGRKAEGLC